MTITIFGSIGSRASRCLWTVEETGQPYEWVSISRLDGSNRTPEYLAINSSGKIPAMTDDAVVMTESTAINLYLAQNYGQSSLWPGDRAIRANILQWTFWSATEIEYYIGTIFPQLVMKSVEDRDHAFVNRLLGEMMPKFDALERALDGKDYVLGDFTLADINLVVQTLTVTDRFGLTLDELPNIKAWTERCRDRPARRKVDALAAAARK